MFNLNIPPKSLSLFDIFIWKAYRFTNRFFWKFYINKKLKNYHKKNHSIENDWWNNEYIKEFHHHSFQNKIISNDFLRNIRNSPQFLSLLTSSKSFVDLWSGTGELSYFTSKVFQWYEKILWLEVSEKAVDIANELYASKVINFLSIKPEDSLDTYEKFDFVICSNTLEHFQKPETIIEKAFNLADIFIALIPYKQPVSDPYEYEGWPWHVNTFDENSFPKYKLIDFIVFRTWGWQTSTAWEEPLQLAVILKKN